MENNQNKNTRKKVFTNIALRKNYLISRRTLIRLKIKRNMKHRRYKLIFLFAAATGPVGNTNRFAYLVRPVVQ